MPLFIYTAKNASGQTTHGNVEARSKELAVSLLKNQGLFVVLINEKKEDLFESLLSFRGIPQEALVTFTRQFSTMISAGLPIARALEVLAVQNDNKKLRKVIYDILRQVEGGASLSVALARYPDVFSRTYQALVAAGESSGKLDEILKRLAETLEASRDLNSKLKGAMVYPVIVVIAMFVVFIILMVFVVPKLAEMYKSMNVPLPMVTQVMISVSGFMVKYIVFVLFAIAGAVIGLKTFLKSEKGKRFVSELVFRMPIFGKINKQKDISQFARTLSLLMNSAVPIVESLNIVATVMSSHTLRLAVLEAAHQVEKGNALSAYFRSSKVFPPLLSQMASVGEETGKMDEVLDRVALYYEGEVDHLVKGLSSALEPVILIMLGAMVGFLIISIITPIYKITSSI
jgi:type IV pilus assembly protein PilC